MCCGHKGDDLRTIALSRRLGITAVAVKVAKEMLSFCNVPVAFSLHVRGGGVGLPG
jgi:hypothetical protein